MNKYLLGVESKKKLFFLYLIEDWISSAIVQTYSLKALATVVWSVTMILL